VFLTHINRNFAVLILALTSLGAASQTFAQTRNPQHVPAPQQSAIEVIGPESHILAPPANYRYPDGQSYVYNIEWRLWTAGTASLRIENEGAMRKVSATADSGGVVALLFTVHDRFEARFDPHTFCSQGIFKHTEEGFHKKETRIRFDYAQRKAVLNEKNLKNSESKSTTQDIPACAMDVVSGIYYLASLPLQVGASYTFPVNDGSKTVDVRSTVEAREQIKTDAGTFNTLRVRADDASGALKSRGSVWIWYTEGAQRIPVQMRARAFWGTLNIKLARVEKK
jgi:Protein of unknown function (DUF3108)